MPKCSKSLFLAVSPHFSIPSKNWLTALAFLLIKVRGIQPCARVSCFSHWLISIQDWRKVRREDIKPDTSPIEAYAASKTLAERAAWEFSESHPELDLITSTPSSP